MRSNPHYAAAGAARSSSVATAGDTKSSVISRSALTRGPGHSVTSDAESMTDSDSEFLMKIADLLDKTPRKGSPGGIQAIMLSDTFARELAGGLRRIAERLKS
jgi:hypothetical protein